MKIALTGTPGTGKTEVAKLLSKKTGWPIIELNKLAEEKGLFCGYDRKRRTKIVDIEKIKPEVAGLKDVILESHYAHEVQNDLTVVLRCEIEQLKRRLLKKGWPKNKIQENIQAEIFGICKEEAVDLKRKILEIDTTGKSPEEVAVKIQRYLRGKRKG